MKPLCQYLGPILKTPAGTPRIEQGVAWLRCRHEQVSSGTTALPLCESCPFHVGRDKDPMGPPKPPRSLVEVKARFTTPCIHRGEALREVKSCTKCSVYACSKHGECVVKRLIGFKSCADCDDYAQSSPDS